MPCKSDYMAPNKRELELGKIRSLQHEVNSGKLISYGDPFLYNTYQTQISQEMLNEETKELCETLQQKTSDEIKEYSLELQIWWRDHQAADKKRLEKEMKRIEEDKKRQEVLDKLTPYEKKLLGL